MNYKHYRYISKMNGVHAELADIRDKEKTLSYYTQYMLARTQSMFRYKNLPETIPQRILELYLQLYGYVCIAEHEGKLYPFYGHLGGEPNPYYMPTICVVANPALKFSKDYVIDKDCIIIPSDSTYSGLLPIFEHYGTLMTENDITMMVANINMRIPALITADDDTTRSSALKYLEDNWAGKLGIIGNKTLLEGVKAQPYGDLTSRNITQLIELHQFYKASMFNEIGLNSNYNMKRETIVSSEIEMNADALFPLVDDMLRNRKQGIKKVNEMFGTDIEIELNSSWERLKEDSDLTKIENELEVVSMIPQSERSDSKEIENDDNSNFNDNDDNDNNSNDITSSDVGNSDTSDDTGKIPYGDIGGQLEKASDSREQTETNSKTSEEVTEIIDNIIEKVSNIVIDNSVEESERSDSKESEDDKTEIE